MYRILGIILLIKSMARVAFFLLLASYLNLASSMTFETVDDTLIMSGPVVADDLARLKDHLGTGKVKLILLHASSGGDLWNGLQLGKRIRSEGIPTAVSGYCASACGLIFLGGKERSYSDGSAPRATQIGLHGAHNAESKKALSQAGPEMIYFIRSMTDDKYPKDFAERTVYTNHPADMIHFLHPKALPPRAQVLSRMVIECLARPPEKALCKPIDGLDTLAMGIATNPEFLLLSAAVKEYLAQLPK
jgi:hypothetical protein